ncbi:MAG: hypothetical protein ONB44_16415 [candidate division KSB1 bacterium]|nr:hypothetical protein [candidate division KSB1 bacterium]MDZ7313146.1 hypothetical protein [candidate division KSB1 bacterium]
MQQPSQSPTAWFKRRAIISLVTIILLVAGVGLYWHLAQSQEIKKLNAGGKGNACTCSQRLDQ